MDSVDVHTDPLILEEWLVCLHEKIRKQETLIRKSDQIFLSIIDLHENVVKVIFSIVEEFNLNSDVKYLSIHLYDKYMNYRNWKAYKNSEKSRNFEASWKKEHNKINTEGKLRLLSCIQLASKMDSNENGLGIPDVQQALHRIDPDREYSKQKILQSEIEVFKVVKFQMPLCTPKDCVDIILAITGLQNTPNILEASRHLLDLSYLCHEELFNSFKILLEQNSPNALFDQKSLMMMKSNALFLGAAITVCSVFFVDVKRNDFIKSELMKIVANLVKIREEEIWDMANLLYSLSVQEL